ncbi:hypothetical protein CRYUN_Cryun09bG0053800 [Craigia yunnanensis]
MTFTLQFTKIFGCLKCVKPKFHFSFALYSSVLKTPDSRVCVCVREREMARFATSTTAALLSSNHRAFSPKSKPTTQSIPLPNSFTGLRAPLFIVSLVPFPLPRLPLSEEFLRQIQRIILLYDYSELPLVGNTAPDFEAEAVFDQEFIKIFYVDVCSEVKLSEYIGKKYVILFFYPLDFTFVCPTEITAFSDRHKEFEKLNTEILGVSVDSVVSSLLPREGERKTCILHSCCFLLL